MFYNHLLYLVNFTVSFFSRLTCRKKCAVLTSFSRLCIVYMRICVCVHVSVVVVRSGCGWMIAYTAVALHNATHSTASHSQSHTTSPSTVSKSGPSSDQRHSVCRALLGHGNLDTSVRLSHASRLVAVWCSG